MKVSFSLPTWLYVLDVFFGFRCTAHLVLYTEPESVPRDVKHFELQSQSFSLTSNLYHSEVMATKNKNIYKEPPQRSIIQTSRGSVEGEKRRRDVL